MSRDFSYLYFQVAGGMDKLRAFIPQYNQSSVDFFVMTTKYIDGVLHQLIFRYSVVRNGVTIRAKKGKPFPLWIPVEQARTLTKSKQKRDSSGLSFPFYIQKCLRTFPIEKFIEEFEFYELRERNNRIVESIKLFDTF